MGDRPGCAAGLRTRSHASRVRDAMSSPDPLAAALSDLDALEAAGLAAFLRAATAEDVEAARIEYLGQKQGKIKTAQERLKTLEPAVKKAYGQRFNAVKRALEESFDSARAQAETVAP